MAASTRFRYPINALGFESTCSPRMTPGATQVIQAEAIYNWDPSFQHADVKILAKALPAPGSTKGQLVSHSGASTRWGSTTQLRPPHTETGDRLLAGFSRSRIILLAILHGPWQKEGMLLPSSHWGLRGPSVWPETGGNSLCPSTR